MKPTAQLQRPGAPMAELRKQGQKALEWIADYLERALTLPTLSQVKPGDIMALLPAHPPEASEPFESILCDLDEKILPCITHWQSPNFYAYFPGNISPPAVIGELL